MHRHRHTGVPTQAWWAFFTGEGGTWLETECSDAYGRVGLAVPCWEMNLRCTSHAYCATQGHEQWKTWSPWAVGSNALDCSWTKRILQGKSWKQLIFRNRLELNSNNYSMLLGAPTPWQDLTANFFHERQPALPPCMKATGWGWTCSTDPAFASIERIR